MNLQQLTSRGFQVVAGQIDRGGKNYGFMRGDEAVLTPDALALLEADDDEAQVPDPAPAPAAAAPARAARKTSRKGGVALPAAPAPAPAEPVDDAAGLANELNALTGD